MTEIPSAPEVEPDYGGQLWPTGSPSTGGRPGGRPPSSRSPSNRRSLGTATLVILLLTLAVFGFAAGFGVADSQARGTDAAAPSSPATPTYEDGLQEGHDEGYTEGFREGKATGLKVGKEQGYENGYTQGKPAGYRSGLIDGCKVVFDELETNKVIDRPAGPYQKYWYLTRDQCKLAGTMGN